MVLRPQVFNRNAFQPKLKRNLDRNDGSIDRIIDSRSRKTKGSKEMRGIVFIGNYDYLSKIFFSFKSVENSIKINCFSLLSLTHGNNFYSLYPKIRMAYRH